MENIELKIETPDGYEIDESRSTFEKIVFKKKALKPKSWEEYCKNTAGYIYYITEGSEVQKSTGPLDQDIDKNALPSEELANAFIAMMQLMSLRQAWIGNWKPNWNDDDESKYCIISDSNNISINVMYTLQFPLSFPTREMAGEFVDCFTDLLNQSMGLY